MGQKVPVRKCLMSKMRQKVPVPKCLMPRNAREKSKTGYFHLIIRGNNRQVLFEDEEDYKFFIKRMGVCCRETGVRIGAYCLMENHVHMLVNDPEDAVGKMMLRLNVGYARYYNGKYERCGHLFQGRYLCEPVENDLYLLTVFRYILNNPRKAGICPASEYRWSSYKAFFREKTSMDLGFVKDRFRTDEAYREFIGEENEDVCLEDRLDKSNPDAKALAVIRDCLGVRSGSEVQKMGKKERNEALRRLKEEGLSTRQIERLTGIGRNTIYRA